MTDLANRVALLTGASGGIGKAIARALADEGVELFLTYCLLYTSDAADE